MPETIVPLQLRCGILKLSLSRVVCMFVLEDAIAIHVPPAKLFTFFDGMDAERYRLWHPEHEDFAWVGEKGARVGNAFTFKETIGGKTMAKSVVFTKIEQDTHIEFAPTNTFLRLILRRLSFSFDPIEANEGHDSGTVFRARIAILTGPIGARFNKKEFDAVRLHMKEEGQNLKRLAESGGY